MATSSDGLSWDRRGRSWNLQARARRFERPYSLRVEAARRVRWDVVRVHSDRRRGARLPHLLGAVPRALVDLKCAYRESAAPALGLETRGGSPSYIERREQDAAEGAEIQICRNRIRHGRVEDWEQRQRSRRRGSLDCRGIERCQRETKLAGDCTQGSTSEGGDAGALFPFLAGSASGVRRVDSFRERNELGMKARRRSAQRPRTRMLLYPPGAQGVSTQGGSESMTAGHQGRER